jgi:transcription elongation factor Elf1
VNDKQKKDYLASGGTVCPECGSTNISAGPVDADGRIATSEVECLNCGHCWQDCYELTDVVAIG